MCPQQEIQDRQETHDINYFEVDPETINLDVKYWMIKPEFAVKKYPKTTMEHDPNNIRTLQTLLSTFNYLLNNILERNDVPFYQVHNFLRDRFRSIIQDLNVQNIRNSSTILILETVIRFRTDFFSFSFCYLLSFFLCFQALYYLKYSISTHKKNVNSSFFITKSGFLMETI
eukprot:Anaeramoba_ignava/a612234_57.p1 GENE.a612234_57~~a612234_57.p1  ORF type:complete len:172 (+),score=37.37 a612234_57:317-832(+)